MGPSVSFHLLACGNELCHDMVCGWISMPLECYNSGEHRDEQNDHDPEDEDGGIGDIDVVTRSSHQTSGQVCLLMLTANFGEISRIPGDTQ